MTGTVIQFAEASQSSSGFGAFNINLKSFIFQLITFVLVLLVFKRWVLPPIQKTLDERRETLEKSLVQAKETEEALAKAEASAEDILSKARIQADEVLSEARKTAAGVISEAEAAAATRAALIIDEAESRLSEERDKLRQDLRGELAELVAEATEEIISEKLDRKKDLSLIEKAIGGLRL